MLQHLTVFELIAQHASFILESLGIAREFKAHKCLGSSGPSL